MAFDMAHGALIVSGRSHWPVQITCTETLLARDRKSLKLFKLLAVGPLQAQNAYGGFQNGHLWA